MFEIIWALASFGLLRSVIRCAAGSKKAEQEFEEIRRTDPARAERIRREAFEKGLEMSRLSKI